MATFRPVRGVVQSAQGSPCSESWAPSWCEGQMVCSERCLVGMRSTDLDISPQARENARSVYVHGKMTRASARERHTRLSRLLQNRVIWTSAQVLEYKYSTMNHAYVCTD